MSINQEKFIHLDPKEDPSLEFDKQVESTKNEFKGFFLSKEAQGLVDDIYRVLHAPSDKERSAEHRRKVASLFLALVAILQEMVERGASRPSFELKEGMPIPEKNTQEALKRFNELTEFLRQMKIISTKNELAQIISDELNKFLRERYGDNQRRFDTGRELLKTVEMKVFRGVFSQGGEGASEEKEGLQEKKLHTFMNLFAHELNLSLALRETNWDAFRITTLPLFGGWRKKVGNLIANNSHIGISAQTTKHMIQKWSDAFVEKEMGRSNESQRLATKEKMNQIISALW